MIRTRLRRLRDKDTRKLIAVILAGKMLGIVAALFAVKAFGWYFGSQATPIGPQPFDPHGPRLPQLHRPTPALST